MRMADYYDKQFRMHSKISNATLYPKILCFVIIGLLFSCWAKHTASIPGFVRTDGRTAPPTKILFAMSDGVKEHWLML